MIDQRLSAEEKARFEELDVKGVLGMTNDEVREWADLGHRKYINASVAGADVNGNTNCLYNIACPKCGAFDSFSIQVTAITKFTDNGSEYIGDTEWDDESPIACCECQHMGKVGDFYINPPTKEAPEEEMML